VRSIKAQYFFAFAVMGSLLPFLPVYLQHRGLNRVQIGYVGAAASLAVLLTPVLLTALADQRMHNRHLLATAFTISGLSLLAMHYAQGLWSILALLAIHSLAYAPMTALQDGLNFQVQRNRQASGRSTTDYHHIRVWGTIGFIVPSVLLYGFLHRDGSIELILVSAATFCTLGLLNTYALPKTPAPNQMGQADFSLHRDISSNVPAQEVKGELPTITATKLLVQPTVLVFCLAMILAHMAAAAFYSFYPLYLKQTVGLENRWLGLIANVGVTGEIFFMLGFGWLLTRLRLKRLMLLGIGCMAVRFALLAVSSSIPVAVGTQILHGMMVLVIHVAPPIFLNRHATDANRNSIQGLYVMAVYGTGRIIGNLLAGYVAEYDLSAVFAYSSGLSVVALALLALAFHDHHRTS